LNSKKKFLSFSLLLFFFLLVYYYFFLLPEINLEMKSKSFKHHSKQWIVKHPTEIIEEKMKVQGLSDGESRECYGEADHETDCSETSWYLEVQHLQTNHQTNSHVHDRQRTWTKNKFFDELRQVIQEHLKTVPDMECIIQCTIEATPIYKKPKQRTTHFNSQVPFFGEEYHYQNHNNHNTSALYVPTSSSAHESTPLFVSPIFFDNSFETFTTHSQSLGSHYNPPYGDAAIPYTIDTHYGCDVYPLPSPTDYSSDNFVLPHSKSFDSLSSLNSQDYIEKADRSHLVDASSLINGFVVENHDPKKNKQETGALPTTTKEETAKEFIGALEEGKTEKVDSEKKRDSNVNESNSTSSCRSTSINIQDKNKKSNTNGTTLSKTKKSQLETIKLTSSLNRWIESILFLFIGK
jgi:hypothetical protein